MIESNVASNGGGEIIIKWLDGREEVINFKNKVVDLGRSALAKSLANQFGGVYRYWVKNMVFGAGGTVGGTPRYVDSFRTGLFGPVIATKPVISSVPISVQNQAIFTSVLLFEDAIGQTVNEMGLQMENGDFFSLTTFGDIVKTNSMQLTFNWRISVI